jgi:hypothetical protein
MKISRLVNGIWAVGEEEAVHLKLRNSMTWLGAQRKLWSNF